jgi:hypothetical protein
MRTDTRIKPSFGSIFFYFLLVILAVFIFLHFTELQKVPVFLKQINPLWFIPAFILQILTYVFVASIYHNLLTRFKYGTAISHWELFKLSMINLFLNQAVPLGGLSGQSYSVYFFQKRKLPTNTGFLVATLETFTYYFTHLLFSIFAVFFLIFFLKKKFSGLLLGTSVFGVLLFIFLSVLVLLLTSEKVLLFIKNRAEKGRWLKFFFNKLNLEFFKREVSAGKWESPVEFVKNKRKYLLSPIFLQILVLLADTFTVFLLFRGFGFRPNVLIVLAGMILTKIIVMISVSPGALVFFEGAMVLFYSSFNIPVHLALIVTLIFRALSFWLPMPFGLFFYKQFSARHKKQEMLSN